MNNKKITTMFILIATILLLGIVGFTIAYFTSSVDFENEFTTGLFQTEATETFTSPENWLPGDTTPKTLTIENTGNANVKARVCISEEWESDNGDPLPNKVNGERAAILNLANTSDWTYRLGCYEYNDVLEPDDVTSSFIESVTFNPNIESDMTCEITTSNGSTTKTCSSSGDGYDNATYTLTFTVETIQASAANELWASPYTYVNRQVDGEITTGDEISIKSEHFYVVSSDSNKTVLLSKYNLLVGDVFDYDRNANLQFSLNKTLSSSDTGYGLQDSEARGVVTGDQTQYVGVVAFSGKGYWDSAECISNGPYSSLCPGTSGLLSEYSQNGETYFSNPHNTNYPYVYRSNIGNTTAPNILYHSNVGYGLAQNNGYTIAFYVENYVNTLKGLGAPNTIEGRLLSYEEADTIRNGSANPIKEHLYDSSYWLGSAQFKTNVWHVGYSGYINGSYYFQNQNMGVRPVIEILTSELN